MTTTVQSLKNDEIIIEGQYPFLNDASMRERNFGVQIKILKTYGYLDTDKLILGAFEVPNEGWMHCFFRLDNLFQSTEEIKQKVICFNSNRRTT